MPRERSSSSSRSATSEPASGGDTTPGASTGAAPAAPRGDSGSSAAPESSTSGSSSSSSDPVPPPIDIEAIPGAATIGTHGHDVPARKAAKGRKPAFDPELLDICEITIDDIAPIYHLGERVFTAERWPTLYRTWDEYEVVQAYLTDADTSLVAFYDDELVGFALGTMIEKPRNPWIYGYLKWLAVSPDHGQLGIGAALVKELRATFIENGARMLLVDTDADNELALRFFRRIGFGQETQHVYLSLNLTHERDYKRVRARKRRSGD